MNLSQRQAVSPGGESGAGGTLGSAANAGPAHPGYQVGAVGFGPQWTMEDSMAASIIRLEQENEELRAEVALLNQGMFMLAGERGEAMLSSSERGVVVSQVSGALVDAGCAVGDAREFGALVTKLAAERDEWRECASRLLVYAECMSARVPEKSQINWTVLEQARAMFREQSK